MTCHKIACLILTSSLLLACSNPTASPVTSPTPARPSPTASPSAAAPAVPVTADGPVKFAPVKGYIGQTDYSDTQTSNDTRDEVVNKVSVLRSQTDFDKALIADEARTGIQNPDKVDFGNSLVIAIAKVSGAYQYQGEITGVAMQAGNLVVQYAYTVNRSSDPMLNDYIRPLYTIVRIDKVNFKEIKVNVQAKTLAASATAQP